MHATMDDIARECGLSKKTISRVFTGSPAVKQSTKDRVQAAAERLSYEVNHLARNLNQNRSGFIGLAGPLDAMFGGDYFAEAFKGFKRAIPDDSDFIFALFDTNSESFNDGTKLAKLYRQRRVDGLLVVCLHTHDRFVGTLEEVHVPMVIVGEKPQNPGACSVYCDDERGITQLCTHLYSLGHSRIAFVQGPSEYATSIRRKRAFLRFMHSKGLENPPWYVQPGDFSLRSGRAAAQILLQSDPRPTAIMAGNDTMALAIMETARAHKLRIPEDISVVGFDDDQAASESSPSLTTSHQPIAEMAEFGARKLLYAINSKTVPKGHTTMEPTLIIRESTGKPGSNARKASRADR